MPSHPARGLVRLPDSDFSDFGDFSELGAPFTRPSATYGALWAWLALIAGVVIIAVGGIAFTP